MEGISSQAICALQDARDFMADDRIMPAGCGVCCKKLKGTSGVLAHIKTSGEKESMSILNVEHLSHGFGDRAIFQDVSFRLLKGSISGLSEQMERESLPL